MQAANRVVCKKISASSVLKSQTPILDDKELNWNLLVLIWYIDSVLVMELHDLQSVSILRKAIM